MRRGGHGAFSEVQGKALDRRLLGRLLRYLRPYRAWVALSVVLMLFGSLLQLAGPAITKLLIDRYIDPSTTAAITLSDRLAGIDRLSLVFLATIVGAFLLQYGQMYLMNLTGQRAMNDLRTELYEHLLELPMSYYDRSSVGWVMTRLTNDIEVLNEMFTSGVVAVFGDFFLLIGIVAFMFYLSPTLAAVVMVVLPLLVFITMWFRAKARDAYAETRAKLGRMNAFLQENLTGIRVVQIFTRERRNENHFRSLNGEYKDAFERTIFYYALFFPGVDFLSALALALLVWFGGGGILAGTMTFGTVYAFILYVERFYRPIRDLAEKYNIMQSAMASSERIFRLLDEEVTISDPSEPVFPEEMAGRVAFCDVWFAYESSETDDSRAPARRGMRSVDVDEARVAEGGTSAVSGDEAAVGVAEAADRETAVHDWVLKDVSFEVATGETVAIVGATGSGKTTIISLLTRLYDIQQGCIRIDGRDIKELDLRRLRASVGVVLQDVFLFSGTIEGNIRLNEPGISREAVETAARHVNADPFIRRLPDGYDSPVHERGATLSAGQRQLLAFARALAFDPAILVLDEATSSVDTETEMLIQDALDKLMQGRTTIVIAHRLSTIQKADKIIVLHKGEVREIGTHAELLAAGGIYHRLYQLQYQAQERGSGARS